MPYKKLVFGATLGILLAAGTVATTSASAAGAAGGQISIGIGVAPVCPYGYFDYAPYDCSPYGYYGPDWFTGGVFIGAGPWFHGPRGFFGHVDNRFDPHNGYHGPLPERGAQPFTHFNGNEARDGQGHTGPANHAPTSEHSGGFSGAGRAGGGFHGGGGRH